LIIRDIFYYKVYVKSSWKGGRGGKGRRGRRGRRGGKGGRVEGWKYNWQ